MYVIRKYNGDDSFSWAVFRKEDIPKGHKGVVFYGETRPPLYSGMSKSEALSYKKKLAVDRLKFR